MIKLENYKILKKIGSGAMGDVYLAEHEFLESTVLNPYIVILLMMRVLKKDLEQKLKFIQS